MLAWLATIVCALMSGTIDAQNVEKVYDFDIREETLGGALAAIARQTDLVVLFPHELASKVGMKPVVGRYTVPQAIRMLLRDTQFSGGLTEHGVIYISISGNEQARHGENETVDPKVRKSLWASVIAFLSGTAVHAQDVGNDVDVQLEEIIVTATKREERLIETPQSVSVLSADALSKLGATQFRDFADTVPGLNFQSGGAGFNQLSLRGVTTGYDISPSVGNVVDDVPYGSSSAFARGAQLALDVGLFDIDRIEVLKGPQGTLYGASTMGGLIKYVTRRPDPSRFGAELQTGVSDTAGGDINYLGAAAVNVPVMDDKAALRVSGFYSHDGGYVDNVALNREDVNASSVSGGRVDFLVLPTDAFSLRLSAVLQDIDRDGTPTVDHTIDREPVYGELRQFRLIPETFEQRFRLVSATATYDAGPVELTSVSSYQTIRSNFIVDDSPLLVTALAGIGRNYSATQIDNGVDTDKFTQEIRLASVSGRPLEWLIGGFYTRESSENRQELLLLDAARQPAPNDLFTYRTPSEYVEYAAFGNVTYYLTEKFDLTAGVRYARNEQDFEQIGSGLLIGSQPNRTEEENVSTYLTNARYRISENATAYARFATGYRPGGPNSRSLDPLTGLPNAPESFEADESKSYEVGFKTQSANGVFGADIAAYYIDWDNLQQLTTTPTGVSYYANANAGAEIKGAELTLIARPVRAFTASAAFAYQDAAMSDDEPLLGAREGERLPNVPRFTAAISADYVFDNLSLEPRFGLTYRSVSDRMASFDANGTVAQYEFDAYDTLDARAGFLMGVAEVQIYVRNVFDEHGQLVIPSGVSAPWGPIEVSTLQPRTIGVTATMRF